MKDRQGWLPSNFRNAIRVKLQGEKVISAASSVDSVARCIDRHAHAHAFRWPTLGQIAKAETFAAQPHAGMKWFEIDGQYWW